MFPGTGTLVNVLSIVIFALIGSLLGSLVKKKMRASLQDAVGLVVILMGLAGSIAALSKISALPGDASKFGILIVLVSLVVGTAIGEFLKIEKGFRKLEKWLSKKLSKNKLFGGDKEDKGHRAFEGFITATIIFAIGAMTILGSIQDGLGNPSTLFVKAGLDGVTSLTLASTLGISVALSALPVLLVQGSIAAFVALFGGALSATAILPLEAVGGIMITAIGFDLIGLKRFSVGSMMPALVIALAVGAFL